MDKNQYITGSYAYRRLVGYARPYWPGFVFAVIGMVMMAASESGFAALMRPMLDGSFVEKDPLIIRWVPWVLLGVFIFRGVGTFISKYLMEWIGRNIIRDLRRDLFQQLIVLPSSYYDSVPKGNLTSKLIFDVEQVANAATKAVTIVIKDSLTLLGLFAWMLFLSWKLSLFFLVLIPIMGVIVTRISAKFREYSRRIQSSMGNVNQSTLEVVSANRIVKVYGAENSEIEKFSSVNDYNRRQNMRLSLTLALNVPLVQFFGAFAMAAVLYYVTNDSDLKGISVGTFMSFITAAMMLLAPIRRMTEITQTLQQGIAAAQSVFQVLDAGEETNNGTIIAQGLRGDIQFEKVGFTYSNSQTAVLQDISFSVHAGKTLAIVGKSGSGKSSLAALLARFYQHQQGMITIDGIAVEEYELNSLRSQIALVSQEVILFNDTVYNNIAYGSNASKTKQEIIDAARKANALEFIEQLSNQFDTIIGDQGVLLSGGQRQRISIARAILKNAPILILDEATSALDTESEQYIQSALNELMKSRTTIIIAHRLSTIENADNIILLEKGRMVESGTHQSLLAKKGHYAALYYTQLDQNEES